MGSSSTQHRKNVAIFCVGGDDAGCCYCEASCDTDSEYGEDCDAVRQTMHYYGDMTEGCFDGCATCDGPESDACSSCLSGDMYQRLRG